MSVIIILIGISMLISGSFLISFFWNVRSGQYDDLESPANRILFDQHKTKNESK